jgi:hypothetical protein
MLNKRMMGFLFPTEELKKRMDVSVAITWRDNLRSRLKQMAAILVAAYNQEERDIS